jgi:hypothetical protein
MHVSMTTYSFIISKRSAEYQVDVNDYGLQVSALASNKFDVETNEVLVRSLQAMGESFLIMHGKSKDTPVELMMYYINSGYIIKDYNKLKDQAAKRYEHNLDFAR